ncbi:membrane protein [Spirochaetia bacterium]|nr:membrane protein [Spirochaetia bacterium]GHU33212.1 membrane protein [Spirochaetia bacterium]
MGIFSKFKTLVASNVNDAIGKAENPEKMLNQLIVEMSEQLVEAKKSVAMAIADEKKLERAADDQATQAKEWERKAMLAVQGGRDDLAKEALLRKQSFDSAYTEYKKQWDAQKASVDKLKDALRGLQNKIEEAQRKKNLLIARAKRAEAQQKIQTTVSSLAGSRTAFEAFDRMAAKVDQLEAEADATAELENSSTTTLDRQFAELESSNSSADIMLLELKQKMKALPDNVSQ